MNSFFSQPTLVHISKTIIYNMLTFYIDFFALIMS